jgi:hypothetical protein
MAVGSRTAACLALIIAFVVPAEAQVISAEVDMTAGHSAEDISAAASQLRIFGEAPGQIQFLTEAAWGQRWSGDYPVIGGGLIGVDPMGSDAFGAAYPYNKRIELIEVYAERYFRPRGALLGARVGRFRTPFGIHTRSDYGYCGFVRPPLIRYDGYFALSNNWLENGATFTAGIPSLFVEASVSRPHDIGSSHRRPGTDGSIRVQGYRGPLIVGVSHARSNPYLPQRFAIGRQAFTGVDLRFAQSGVQLRGEMLKGHSHEGGVSTLGWYLDALVHRAGMGPFTALLRAESLDYDAEPIRAREAKRFTMGMRVRWPQAVTTQVNYMRQAGDLPHIKTRSLDFSVTYSLRFDWLTESQKFAASKRQDPTRLAF